MIFDNASNHRNWPTPTPWARDTFGVKLFCDPDVREALPYIHIIDALCHLPCHLIHQPASILEIPFVSPTPAIACSVLCIRYAYMLTCF